MQYVVFYTTDAGRTPRRLILDDGQERFPTFDAACDAAERAFDAFIGSLDTTPDDLVIRDRGEGSFRFSSRHVEYESVVAPDPS